MRTWECQKLSCETPMLPHRRVAQNVERPVEHFADALAVIAHTRDQSAQCLDSGTQTIRIHSSCIMSHIVKYDYDLLRAAKQHTMATLCWSVSVSSACRRNALVRSSIALWASESTCKRERHAAACRATSTWSSRRAARAPESALAFDELLDEVEADSESPSTADSARSPRSTSSKSVEISRFSSAPAFIRIWAGILIKFQSATYSIIVFVSKTNILARKWAPTGERVRCASRAPAASRPAARPRAPRERRGGALRRRGWARARARRRARAGRARRRCRAPARAPPPAPASARTRSARARRRRPRGAPSARAPPSRPAGRAARAPVRVPTNVLYMYCILRGHTALIEQRARKHILWLPICGPQRSPSSGGAARSPRRTQSNQNEQSRAASGRQEPKDQHTHTTYIHTHTHTLTRSRRRPGCNSGCMFGRAPRKSARDIDTCWLVWYITRSESAKTTFPNLSQRNPICEPAGFLLAFRS